MIILLVIAATLAAVVGILEILPAWTPIDLGGAIADLQAGAANGVFDALGWLNWYLPVSEMLGLLVLQTAIWGTVWVVEFVVWLAQLFRVAGSTGK